MAKWYDENGTDIDAYPEKAFQGGVYDLSRMKGYLKHKKDCDIVTNEHPRYNPCSCGLDNLLNNMKDKQ